MVIGHGDIASVLPKNTGKLFFASGVSNSGETRESEYLREALLLQKQPRGAHLVYFSSLAIFYSDTRYTVHKLRMEAIIKHEFNKHCIIRLGNITGGQNPHTLINFLKNQLKENTKPEIQDVYRYVTTPEELLHWVDLIPDWSCEINIPGRMMKVKDILKEIKAGRL